MTNIEYPIFIFYRIFCFKGTCISNRFFFSLSIKCIAITITGTGNY